MPLKRWMNKEDVVYRYNGILLSHQKGQIPNICKSINVIEQINKRREKNHMVLSIDAEKAFDKIQHLFLIKTLQSIRIEETFLNFIKSINEKPTVNIIFNGEKLTAFPLRSGTRQGCPLSPLLFNIVLEVIDTAIRRQQQQNIRYLDWQWRSQTLFADDMILYMENPKDSTLKLLELIQYSNVAG